VLANVANISSKRDIGAGTGVLIEVEGFTVEQTLPGWFSEPEKGWNEKES
jgi:hypothetical protein